MYNTTRIRLAQKPGQQFTTADFKSEQITLAEPQAGEVICRAHYISLDPYLAQMMQAWQGPQPEWSQGIIVGRMVGEVIAANNASLQVGDWVTGDNHWQGLELAAANTLQKIRIPEGISPSVYLGALGSSGLTAWIGIHQILKPTAGETLTISSAAGTVGAIAGQLAKAQGVNVIGIAGGAAKCNEVVTSLGFDACIDHTAPDFEAQLTNAVRNTGIHAHYENVGAKTLDPVLALMNDQGRIGLCGLIAHYLNNDAVTLKNFRKLLTSGLSLTGFRVYDYLEHAKQAQSELQAAVLSGNISIRETITDGLENAPAGYIAMLASNGTGKHLVRLTH